MAPLKMFLMCSGIAAVEECLSNCEAPGDQTALLQSHLSRKGELAVQHTELQHFPSLGHLQDPKKRRGSLAQFEQTATNLVKDRGSVTPAVVTLASQIVDLLEGDGDGDGGILTSILDEHHNDVNQLNYEFIVFAPLQERRGDLEAAISGYDSSLTHAQHLDCRESESTLCQALGVCSSDLAELEEAVNDAEEALQSIDADIHDGWCVQTSDHTAESFMVASNEDFKSYNEALTNLTAATEALEAVACSEEQSSWDAERQRCNTLQVTVESSSCKHQGLVVHDRSDFNEVWLSAVNRYDATKVRVIADAADRIVEWTTIKKVVCLLEKLMDSTAGSAASADNAAAIAACHDLDVDINSLQIVIKPTPTIPPETETTSENPCLESFRTDHYSAIDQVCVQTYPDLLSGPNSIGSCTCLQEEGSPYISVGGAFPHALISYLLYDAEATFGSDGFSLDVDTKIWTLVDGSTTYTGSISSTSAISLPSLNEAYGLSGSNTVSSYAWAYPADGQQFSTTDGETALFRFLRTGGYVYLNEAGATVALKAVTPWIGADDEAQMTLHWLEPVSLSEPDATSACDGMHLVTSGRLQFGGATDYCWAPADTNLAGCEHGCFIFKTQSDEGDEYISFGIMV